MTLPALYGTAAISAISGLTEISRYNEINTEYLKIAQIADTGLQNKSAIEAMERMAHRRKTQRYGIATVQLAVSLFYFIVQPLEGSRKDESANNLLGAAHLYASGLEFIFPSPAEKTLKRYRKDLELNNPAQVGIRTNYKDELQLVLFKNF